MKKYPFKFLDAYNRDDKGIFFGRDEEVDTLYEMIFQSSVILVYGASGTGKTSLINCGLAGRFEPHDWLPLMIRRGNDLNDSLNKALANAGGNASDVLLEDEWSGEDKNAIVQRNAVCRAIGSVYRKSFRPVYLIFDQFEELFILGHAEEEKIFIHTVKDILESDLPVKMIFSIREEYLGYLYNFERIVPLLLHKKLRIEPMNLNKVKQVLYGVSAYEDSNVRLKPGEEEELIKGIFDKIRGKSRSLTIQLPFFQIFLDKFYLSITGDETRQEEAVFSLQALSEMEEMDDVLVDFLEEQVLGISKRLKPVYPSLTSDTIWKILSPFSTLEGTKEPIGMQGIFDRLPDTPNAMINDVIGAFLNCRILRFNEVSETYEIAHDCLAKPIADKRSMEEKASLEIKRLIQSQVAVKPEARAYFTEKQLLFMEPYLGKFKLTEEEKNWIDQSRTHLRIQQETEKKKQDEELAKAKKRLRVVFSLLGLVLLALITAGYFWYDSNEQKEKAITEEQKALSEKDSANSARIEARQALEQVRDQIAKMQKRDFEDLRIRTEPITYTGGCPVEILIRMDSIASIHRDSVQMRSTIASIRKKCK